MISTTLPVWAAHRIRWTGTPESATVAVGFWLATLAQSGVLRISGNATATLAAILRVAMLGLVPAMGSRAMDIANDIVSLTFRLFLGAVAVAVSSGLGRQKAAGKHQVYWLSSLRKK